MATDDRRQDASGQRRPDFQPDARPDLLAPILSAAIFGYYGFFAGLATIGRDGEPVALWIAFVWALRGAAVLFALSAAVALAKARVGLLVYGASGVVATGGLLAVFVWDLASPDGVAIHPAILLILIVWNGYGSLTSFLSGLRRAA